MGCGFGGALFTQFGLEVFGREVGFFSEEFYQRVFCARRRWGDHRRFASFEAFGFHQEFGKNAFGVGEGLNKLLEVITLRVGSFGEFDAHAEAGFYDADDGEGITSTIPSARKPIPATFIDRMMRVRTGKGEAVSR